MPPYQEPFKDLFLCFLFYKRKPAAVGSRVFTFEGLFSSHHLSFCSVSSGAYRERVYRSFTRNVANMQHFKSPCSPLQSHVSLRAWCGFMSYVRFNSTICHHRECYKLKLLCRVPQVQRTSKANHANLPPAQLKNSTTLKTTRLSLRPLTPPLPDSLNPNSPLPSPLYLHPKETRNDPRAYPALRLRDVHLSTGRVQDTSKLTTRRSRRVPETVRGSLEGRESNKPRCECG